MATLTCPRCGANPVVSLATPDRIRCPSCSFDGPPPSDAADSLRRAAAVLAASRASDRQLDESQRRALLSAGRGAGCAGVGLALVLLPLLLLAVVSVRDAGRSSDAGAPPLLVACVVVAIAAAVIAVAAAGWRKVRRSRDRLGVACAATPPASPGQPATCHCCGGPLPDATAAFARCPYCNADNLVAPAWMERAAERRRASSKDIVEQVSAQSRAVALAGAWTLGKTVFVAVVAFFSFPFAAGFLLTLISLVFPLALDPARTYAFVDTPAGSCVVRAAPGPASFTGPALVGRNMRAPDGATGRVTRLYRIIIEIENVADLDDGSHVTSGAKVVGLCAVDR